MALLCRRERRLLALHDFMFIAAHIVTLFAAPPHTLELVLCMRRCYVLIDSASATLMPLLLLRALLLFFDAWRFLRHARLLRAATLFHERA